MNRKTNRNFFRALVALTMLCLLALVAAPATSLARSELDFTLVNDTGYEINKVFMCPVGSGQWGNDILGKGHRIADGDSQAVVFPRRDNHTGNWDLRIMWNNGSTRSWTNIDLKEIRVLTLHYKNERAWVTTK